MTDAVKVGAAALRAMLLDGAELALIDVREERIFSESHLLFARSVPLSRLELRCHWPSRVRPTSPVYLRRLRRSLARFT